jgi:hypothetical protein
MTMESGRALAAHDRMASPPGLALDRLRGGLRRLGMPLVSLLPLSSLLPFSFLYFYSR